MNVFCLYKAWSVDAGKVPENWTPPGLRFGDLDSDPQITQKTAETSDNLEIKKAITHRKCLHCNRWKPERTHHCRKCGRCVLKMDHHCPWTNSCIGFYNYKYYMLLLFWAGVAITFVLISQISPVYGIFQQNDRTWTDWWVVFNYFCSIVMMLSVGALGLFHCAIIVKNMTTLEYREKKSINPDYVNLYDINPADNWVQVFGPDPFLWIIPTRKGIGGDGLSFPKNSGASYFV